MALRIKETFGYKCNMCGTPGSYFGVRFSGTPVSADVNMPLKEIIDHYKKIEEKEKELRALGVELPKPVHDSYGDYRCDSCKQGPT